MHKDVAEQLMDKLHQLGALLNQMADLVEPIDDPAERRMLLTGLGELMGRSFTDVMLPIIRQYPELDPDPPYEPPSEKA